MKVFIINGPNINMLGIREPNIYGNETYDNLLSLIKEESTKLNVEIVCFQSNVEGEIVNFIQKAYFEHADGIIINPAAYTHTSIAILDALKATNLPTIEVHISDINSREQFRKISLIKDFCKKSIIGEGINGYIHALHDIAEIIGGTNNGNN